MGQGNPILLVYNEERSGIVFRRLRNWLSDLWREYVLEQSPEPSPEQSAEAIRRDLERIRQWASAAKAITDDTKSRLKRQLQRHGEIGQSLAASVGTCSTEQARRQLETLLGLEEGIRDLVIELPRLGEEAQRRTRIWHAAQRESRQGHSLGRFLSELETAETTDVARGPKEDEPELIDAIAEVETAQIEELAAAIVRGELPNGINGHPVIIGELRLFEEAHRLIKTE